MPTLKARRKGQDLRKHPALIRLSELEEDILWALRNAVVVASDPEWCSAADHLMDLGLVDEDDGAYSITDAGRLRLKLALG